LEVTELDKYFKSDKADLARYPLIRLLQTHKGRAEFGSAKVEIHRPRAALGFEPAQLSLLFFDNRNEVYDYKTEPWDADLNNALVQLEIRATDDANEIQRFGLALGDAFRRPETRYGDGFFSAVLMLVVDQSPFAMMDPVRELRPYINVTKPYQQGHSAEDCDVMVQTILQDRWFEILRNLHYDEPHAERILAAALAYYLDERFGISDGRKLGWLKAQ
jgi:hypothetical protein